MARDFLFGFWKLWLLLHHNRCYLFNNALDQPLTNPLPFEVGIRRADCAEFGAMLGNGSSRGLLFTGGYGRCFTDNPRRVNCFDTRAHLLSTKCLTRLLRSGGHLLARLVADNELTQVRRRRPFLLFVIAFATAFDVEARASLHEGVHCSPPLGTSTSATWVPPGLLLGCTPTHTSNSRVRERFSFNAELPPPPQVCSSVCGKRSIQKFCLTLATHTSYPLFCLTVAVWPLSLLCVKGRTEEMTDLSDL